MQSAATVQAEEYLGWSEYSQFGWVQLYPICYVSTNTAIFWLVSIQSLALDSFRCFSITLKSCVVSM